MDDIKLPADAKNASTWFNYRPLSKSSTYEVLPDTYDQSIQHPQKRPKKFSRSQSQTRGGLNLSDWTLELSSAVLSICALAALIAVLKYANGLIVHSWHGITLNAVVSALATISELAAAYVAGSALAQAKWCLFKEGPQSLNQFEAVDLASRGVAGCFGLLFGARRFTLVGAYALILAVIFDPFAQQLVHTTSDVVYKQSDGARVPLAKRYSAGNRLVVQATDLGGGPQIVANADYNVQSAIASALVLPMDDIRQQLNVNCRSGNCTWPAFESIAVCSSCNNVHSYLKSTPTDQVLLEFLSYANYGAVLRAHNFSQPTLPNGLVIDESVNMTTFGTSDPTKTVSMRGVDTLIWSMTFLKAVSETERQSFSSYEAHECALRYCVQHYESAVVDNEVQETSKIIENATRNPGSWLITDQETLNFYTSKNAMNETVTKAELRSLDYISPAAGIERSDLQLGTKYNISQTAVNGISALMYSTFNMADDKYPNITGFYSDNGAEYIQYAQYAPASLLQFRPWTSKSLEESFQVLAVSMSNAIRAGSDNKASQSGQEGYAVIKFQIVWPWITLPMIVILGSLLQLFVVIGSSRSVPLWKESTLAVLSRGRLLRGLLDDSSTRQEMRSAAERSRVNLLEDRMEMRSLTGSTY